MGEGGRLCRVEQLLLVWCPVLLLYHMRSLNIHVSTVLSVLLLLYELPVRREETESAETLSLSWCSAFWHINPDV